MSNRNQRDIHGDGHGFVDVPIGRRPDPHPWGKFNYDLQRMPTHKRPFLGLYVVSDESVVPPMVEPRIVINAKPHRGFRLVSYENHHYLADPIAWAELPER